MEYNKTDYPQNVSVLPEKTPLNIHELPARVNQAITRLNTFSTDSEKVFISIGNKLQEFLVSSRSITDNALLITSKVSTDLLQKGMTELELFLNEVAVLLSDESKKIGSDKNELSDAFLKIEKISSELKGFDKIVKRLRMLGISTKIESSRLNLEEAGFFDLAENVDRLSNVISDKVKIISKQSDFLLAELIDVINKLEFLRKEQEQKSKVILQNIEISLVDCKEKNNDFLQKTNQIAELFKGVTSSINDIVSSIQFHDITRQQMEHSSQALNNLSENLQQNTENARNETFISNAFDIIELQSIQLSNSMAEFLIAVETIISSLDNLSGNISSIYSASFGKMNEEDNEHSSDFQELENHLRQISDSLLKDVEIGDQLATSIKSILGIVDKLATYITEIEEVGSEIEIIALNARVKAAHFGIDGSALGVLAESIQRLSIESKQQTGFTSVLFSEINNNTESLKTDIEPLREDGNERSVLAATKEIDGLLNTIGSVENEITDEIHDIKNYVNSLRNDIENVKCGITIHEKAQQDIGDVIKELNNYSDAIKSNFHLKSNRERNTKELLTAYTMHSERNVHMQFTGNTGNFSTAEINKKDGTPFGDNVELF